MVLGVLGDKFYGVKVLDLGDLGVSELRPALEVLIYRIDFE